MVQGPGVGARGPVMTAEDIIKQLGLRPHKEGGFFAESWRAPERLAVNALPPRYSGSRAMSTSIFYMLTHDTFSRMHRLLSDEVFHFYLGEPVEMLLLGPRGARDKVRVEDDVPPGNIAILGNDVGAGQRPQIVVPRGTWQGAHLMSKRKGAFALMGTTTAPGFEYDDYQEGERARLVQEYPGFAEKIRELTR